MTTSDTIGLIRPPRPCPFCGCDSLEVQELDLRAWALTCPCCHAIGPMDAGQSPLRALERWNGRARHGAREDDRVDHIHIGEPTP